MQNVLEATADLADLARSNARPLLALAAIVALFLAPLWMMARSLGAC